MADLIGTPVATQIKPFTGMSLSEMVNMAGGLQQLQQAAQVNPLIVRQQKAATQSAELGANEQRFKKIADSQISMIYHPLVVEAAKNPNAVDRKKLADLVLNNGLTTAKGLGIPEDQAKQLLQPYLDEAVNRPENLQNYFVQRHVQGLGQAIGGALTPTGTQVTGFAPTGEKVTQQVNVNPFAGGMGAPIPGTQSFAGPGMPMQATGRVDPQGNPTAYVTDPRTGEIREVTIPAGIVGGPVPPPPGGPGVGVPSPDMTGTIPPGAGAGARGPVFGGLPPPPPGAPANYEPPKRLTAGEAGMLEQNIKTAREDWNQTVFDNAGAQARIASLQKIKSLVPEAFTFVGGEQKKFVSGLLQSIGLPVNIAETSSTEELAKNAAILNLVGGNTDAAREIAKMATPGTNLSRDGILRVTNQLIGLERMKQSKAQFLAPYANDASKYAEVKQNFDRYADPRMFQEASPEEVAKMKAAMSPKEREEFAKKVKMARQLGII